LTKKRRGTRVARLDNRKWACVALLSVIVPLSLLATFKLISILYQPATAIVSETIVLDTLKWEVERPASLYDVWDKIEGRYGDEDITILQHFLATSYDYSDICYRSPSFRLEANVTATVKIGYVESVSVVFRENNESALIDIGPDWPYNTKVENLSIIGVEDLKSEAFINMSGTDRPSSISFWSEIYWALYSAYNQTHQLDITSEITYYNGTVFKKIVQPFQLKLVADDNNSFDTAQEIHEGIYERLFIGPPVVADERDYYKIYADVGHRIKVVANATQWLPHNAMPLPSNPIPYFALRLYNPGRNQVFRSQYANYTQTVDFIADSAGYWFIEVRIDGGYGFYFLEVSR